MRQQAVLNDESAAAGTARLGSQAGLASEMRGRPSREAQGLCAAAGLSIQRTGHLLLSLRVQMHPLRGLICIA